MAKKKKQKESQQNSAFSAVVVLVVLILFIVAGVRSCRKPDPNPEPSTPDSVQTSETVSSSDTEQEPLTAEAEEDFQAPAAQQVETAGVMDANVIYLSPIQDAEHGYICDSFSNDADVMRRIGETAAEALRKRNLTVYLADSSLTVEERIAEAAALHASVYVVLKSNSREESTSVRGAQCFYLEGMDGSKQLTEQIYNSISQLTPGTDIGCRDESYLSLYELENAQCPVCVAGIEFRDTDISAKWILKNETEIAKALADGIVRYQKCRKAGV